MNWKLFALLPALCLNVGLSTPLLAKKAPSFQKKKEVTKIIHCPISLKVPADWERIDDPSQLPEKVKLLYIGKGKGQFTPSINIACEVTSLSLDEYVETAKKYHEGLGETLCNKMGGVETKAGEAQLLQIAKRTAWGDLRFLQASIICNGTAYVITATATQEEFASLYTHFYQAILSFEI